MYFRIDVKQATDIKSHKLIYNEKNDGIFIVEKYMEKIIDKSILAIEFGIHNISNSSVKKIRQPFVNEYTDIQTEAKYIIETQGSNLTTILEDEKVDADFTYSTNIYEVFQNFGIEAVRELLINEVYNVLEGVKNLDTRHISLLVDRMLFVGDINSIKINTMQKFFDVGPLALGSYESVITNLQQASIRGKIDTMKGISAAYMTAQIPDIGTGAVNVVI
jgi:DNA-directed RNA polymerase beta' subunit